MSAHPNYPCIMQDGRPTHVLVPIDDFRARFGSEPDPPASLMDAARDLLAEVGDRQDADAVLVREALAAVADESTAWLDAGSVRVKLAGSRLAAIRKARGLSQQALGEAAGLPQSQVSRIERDPDRASVATMRKLAEALEVSVSDLI